MSTVSLSLRRLVRADHGADRVVPPSGFTVWLTLFASGAMAFLAVFTLALSMASGRLAVTWSDALAASATLRISAPAGDVVTQTARALEILAQTPGVASATAMSDTQAAALLEPWFGAELPLDRLPIPQLIEIEATPEGFDAAGLRLRLQAEVPGAVLDQHEAWRAPLTRAATRLRALGWSALLLIAGTMAAIVTLAANAALAANAQVIAVLRLVGATDGYIAGAFVRRFTLRSLTGAVCGCLLGVLALLALPGQTEAEAFLTGLRPVGLQWLSPLALPPLAALVALFATRAAARRVLRDLA